MPGRNLDWNTIRRYKWKWLYVGLFLALRAKNNPTYTAHHGNFQRTEFYPNEYLIEFTTFTGVEKQMADDLTAIHPELREVWKKIPRLTFNRWNVRIFQWLTRLQPGPHIPEGIDLEQVYVQSQDGKQAIRLRVYKSKHVTALAPALVWIHGGGFIIGSPEQDDAYAFELARELGIVIVSIDYRLAPQHPFPTPLDDCYTALQWVHTHTQQMGVDPSRIAVGGASAGGGLAANLVQLAQDRGEIPLVLQLLVFPMLDDKTALRTNLPHAELMIWNQKSNRFGWESYLHQACGSNPVPHYAVAFEREDLTGFPPAWIGVGTLDLFHDEDVAYAQKLRNCGVDCELVIVPGAFHGFDVLNDGVSVIQDFRKSQMAALKRYLFP
jgi:acetyl esterase/lipase